MNMKLAFTVLAAVAALSAQTAVAQTCAVPLENIRVEGLRLGESAASFKKRFPNPREYGEYSPERMGMSDFVLMISDISLRGGKVSSFKIAFEDSDTSSAKLPAVLGKRYGLPKQGWKKAKGGYVYQCADYRLHVSQTGGDRGGIGAVLKASVN
ncbi:MAG: hypothetical protein Q4D63_01960 [Neisseria animaloris]|nr:hypothetical protein [Neisseria animaloris]